MATCFYTPGELDDAFYLEQNKLLGELYSSTDISVKMKLEHTNLVVVVTVYKDEKCAGRVAVYHNPIISVNNKNTFLLGKYECIDDAETSHTLLHAAMYWVKDQGARVVIGPMDGSTWNTYRFCVEQQGDVFFTEPVHKTYYPKQFENVGFTPLADYVSSKQTQLHALDERTALRKKELEDNGIYFRPISKENFEEDLRKVYPLCCKAFEGNYLYSPITENEFISMYSAVKPVLNENLVLLAEHKNKVIGFIFGLDNIYDKKTKGCIVKTLARDNDPLFKGVANVLSGMFTQYAFGQKYQYILHALMIEDNASVKVSQNYHGTVVSRYRLYQKEI